MKKQLLLIPLFCLPSFSNAVEGVPNLVLLKESWRACPLRITFEGDSQVYGVEGNNPYFDKMFSMSLTAYASGQDLSMWVPSDNGGTNACDADSPTIKHITTMSIKR